MKNFLNDTFSNVVAGGILTLCSVTYFYFFDDAKETKEIGLVSSVNTTKDYSSKIDHSIYNEDKVKNIIKKYSNNTFKSLLDYKWFSLNNKNMYFFARYIDSNEKENLYIFIIESDSKPKVIFQERESIKFCKFGYVNKKPYILIYSIEGSGSFLYAKLYSASKLGYLVATNFEYGAITNAFVSSFNDEIIIRDNGQLYKIAQSGEQFILEAYNSEITYPNLGENIHILHIEEKNSDIVFKFDNEIISFKKKEDEITFSGAVEKKLNFDDKIIVISEVNLYRTSVSGIFELEDDVFQKISISKPKNNHSKLENDAEIYFESYDFGYFLVTFRTIE